MAGSARYAECPANRRLRGADIQGDNHCGAFLRADAVGTAAPSAMPACCIQASFYPLLGQRPLELSQRARQIEQELPRSIVVSICSAKERNAMPRALRLFTVARRCGSERPSQFSFQTTKQPPIGEGPALLPGQNRCRGCRWHGPHTHAAHQRQQPATHYARVHQPPAVFGREAHLIHPLTCPNFPPLKK